MIYVTGSGLSGIAAAVAVINRGYRPTILDVGLTPGSEASALKARLASVEPEAAPRRYRVAIPLRELEEFASQRRERVGIPFFVFGVIPSSVKREKIEVLTRAGMNRVRMGIESGRERIVKFYKRPTTTAQVEKAANTLAEFRQYHINPGYDVIVDNPIETRQDVIDTIGRCGRHSRTCCFNC